MYRRGPRAKARLEHRRISIGMASLHRGLVEIRPAEGTGVICESRCRPASFL